MNITQIPDDPALLKQLLIQERKEKLLLGVYVNSLVQQLKALGAEPPQFPSVEGKQSEKKKQSEKGKDSKGKSVPTPAPAAEEPAAPTPSQAPTPGKRLELKARRGKKGQQKEQAEKVGRTFQYSDNKREMLSEQRAQVLAQPILQALKENDPERYSTINLSGKSYDEGSARIMAAALQPLRGIKTADFHDIISGRSREEVVKVLNSLCSAIQHHSLDTLNLSDNALGAQGVQACAPALKTQKQLRHLYFNNGGLESEAAKLITTLVLDPHPTKTSVLETFEIYNNCLKDAGAKNLSPIYASSPELRHIRFGTSRLDKGGEGATALLAAIKKGCRKLQHLDLADNNFSGELCAPDLLEIIRNNQELRYLSLDNNFLKKALPAVLRVITEHTPHLEVLKLGGLDLDAKTAQTLLVPLLKKKQQTLRELSLADNSDLGSEGVIPVVKVLKDVPRLETLVLSTCGITGAAVKAIVDNVCTAGLKRLDLNGNRISPAGVAAIRDARKAQGHDIDDDGTWSDNDAEDEEEDGADIADAFGDLTT